MGFIYIVFETRFFYCLVIYIYICVCMVVLLPTKAMEDFNHFKKIRSMVGIESFDKRILRVLKL